MLYPSLFRKNVCGQLWCVIINVYSDSSVHLGTGSFDVNSFADRLWGDIYFNEETRGFTRKASDPESNRTFVHFILNPLYKLYSHVLSEETDDLRKTLASLGIQLKPIMYKMDVRPLLKAVLDQFFGRSTGLVDVIVEHIPSPIEGAAHRVFRVYLVDVPLLTYFGGGKHILGSPNFRTGDLHEGM